MSLTVETGAGLSDSEAYADPATVAAYAEARGLAWAPASAALAEAACREGTSYLDRAYRTAYSGDRAKQRDQRLEWPRINAFADQYALPADQLPRELVEAACEAAIRALASPGSLSPDTDTAAVTSVTAGPVSVTFGGGGTTGAQTFPAINGLIAPLLRQGQQGGGTLFSKTGRC